MKQLIYLFVLAFCYANSFAGVQLRNGNFFITYLDSKTTLNGATLELARTYNSKSNYVGWFGYGWGTEYEVRLEPSADGSVFVFENGSGAVNKFYAKSIDPAALKKVIDLVVASVKAKKPINKATEDQLVARLSKDPEYLQDVSVRYKIKNDIKVGTVLTSIDFPGQNVEVTGDGYVRNLPTGIKQFFNKEGRITKSRNTAGYGLDFTYNKAWQVTKLVDTTGNQLIFEWLSTGRIKSVSTHDKKKASYDYKGDDLVKSVDTENRAYSFTYDSNHNLVKLTDLSIKDNTKNSLLVKYDPKTFDTLEVINRDGSSNEYIYKVEKKKDSTLTSTIVLRKEGGTTIGEKYEYFYKIKANGAEWLARYLEITNANYDVAKKQLVGGNKEETFYEENKSFPVKKVEGDKEISYGYTSDSLLQKRVTKFKGKLIESMEYAYHPVYKKVTEAKSVDINTKYEYNNKAELVKAFDNKGNAILFVYDINGRITKMFEKSAQTKASRTLAFTYNVKGKPTVVELEGVGKLDIKYDSQTQTKVEDVKSSKGLEVYNQVRSVVSSFMDVIRPTGISLSI